MTRKSTEAIVELLCRRGQLISFNPRLPVGESQRRWLWLHPEVSRWVWARGSDRLEQRHFDDVRAFLTSFIIGDDFDDDVRLKELKTSAHGWYELRIIFHPQHRMIGGFVKPGEFVALTHGRRDRLDKNFAPTIDRARKLWTSLFPDCPPSVVERALLLETFDV